MYIYIVYDYMNMEKTMVSHILCHFALVMGEGNVGRGAEEKGGTKEKGQKGEINSLVHILFKLSIVIVSKTSAYYL